MATTRSKSFQLITSLRKHLVNTRASTRATASALFPSRYQTLFLFLLSFFQII
ncbi:hypothetical protein AtNW77_Chr3g0157671 [Arabidopsis thaliana]